MADGVIKLLVVDDHAVVRAGLSNILSTEPDIEVVGEARNGNEAISKVRLLQPDVILMDILMPNCSGLEAILSIKESQPHAQILVLTISDQDEDLFQALKLGVHGYLLKGAPISDIISSVRKVAAGEVMLSPHMVARLVGEFRENGKETDNGPALSARELEVLELVGKGLTNTEIGEKLFIGESTVRTYLRRLLEKLHLRNRSEAVAYATRQSVRNHNH